MRRIGLARFACERARPIDHETLVVTRRVQASRVQASRLRAEEERRARATEVLRTLRGGDCGENRDRVVVEP